MKKKRSLADILFEDDRILKEEDEEEGGDDIFGDDSGDDDGGDDDSGDDEGGDEEGSDEDREEQVGGTEGLLDAPLREGARKPPRSAVQQPHAAPGHVVEESFLFSGPWG